MNKTILKSLKMGGKGGKEQEYQKALGMEWERVSAPLWDFVNKNTGERLELKKQKNLQWLDPLKYGDADRSITMHLLCYDDKGPDLLLETTLGNLLDLMKLDNKFFKTISETKKKTQSYKYAEKMQMKLPVKIRDLEGSSGVRTVFKRKSGT